MFILRENHCVSKVFKNPLILREKLNCTHVTASPSASPPPSGGVPRSAGARMELTQPLPSTAPVLPDIIILAAAWLALNWPGISMSSSLQTIATALTDLLV